MILNKEQFRCIKDHNLDYFKDNSFTMEQKEEILNYAVEYGKTDIIKYYMEQGLGITRDSALINLMTKNSKTELLDYLESKGVDFIDNDNILLHKAIYEKNLKFSEYLADKIIDMNSQSTQLALKQAVEKFQSKGKKLFTILVKKLSSDGVKEVLSNIDEHEDLKKFIFSEFLKINLQEHKSQRQMKI